MAKRETVEVVKLGFAYVLAALYNNARVRKRRFRSYNLAPMTVEEAFSHIARTLSFGTLGGRTLNITFNDDDDLDVTDYNIANGPNLGQRVIQHLRATGSIGKLP